MQFIHRKSPLPPYETAPEEPPAPVPFGVSKPHPCRSIMGLGPALRRLVQIFLYWATADDAKATLQTFRKRGE